MRVGNSNNTNSTSRRSMVEDTSRRSNTTSTSTNTTTRSDFRGNDNTRPVDAVPRNPRNELRRTATPMAAPSRVGGDVVPESTTTAPRTLSRSTAVAEGGDVPPGTPAPALEDLRRGVSLEPGHAGASVAEMQDRLTQIGHGVQRTGEYGPTTEGVVQDFQRSAGLSPDGIFGRNSMAALQRAEMAPRPEHDAIRAGVEGGRVFQNGDKGAAVVDAQRLLNSAGFRTGVDGDYGPGTEQAVRNFQAANNIQQNGQIGETTLNALREVAAERAQNVDATASTDGMSTQQQYDHYRGLIEANGGQFRTGPNQFNIVSLRTETDADVNGGGGRYDDRTALVWTDSQGRPHVEEFDSNTEPSARYRNRMGVDANGDGRLDQGRLPAGYYEYRTGHSGSLGRVLRPTADTMAERDTNHDGLFNDGVMASAGRSMLFHAGGNSITGSAGCQTMTPGDYNRFWNHLNSAGNPGTIGYTLINL